MTNRLPGGFEDAPAAIQSLVRALIAEGFREGTVVGSGSHNMLMELTLHRWMVRIGVDRSEWWVDMGSDALGDTFDADIWASCLDETPVNHEPSALDDQAEFVRRRWRDAEEAIRGHPDLDRCLERGGMGAAACVVAQGGNTGGTFHSAAH